MYGTHVELDKKTSLYILKNALFKMILLLILVIVQGVTHVSLAANSALETPPKKQIASQGTKKKPSPIEFLPFKIERKKGASCKTKKDCKPKSYCQIAQGKVVGVCVTEVTVVDDKD